jgi:hypothetical protein
VHCLYKGCKVTTKTGQKRSRNWREWQLCKEHALELHSKELEHCKVFCFKKKVSKK